MSASHDRSAAANATAGYSSSADAAAPLSAQQRDGALSQHIQKLSGRMDKQSADLQVAMQTTVSTSVTGAVNQAMSNSFEQFSKQWEADFSQGMDALRQKLATEDKLEQRFKAVETSISNLSAAVAAGSSSHP